MKQKGVFIVAVLIITATLLLLPKRSQRLSNSASSQQKWSGSKLIENRGHIKSLSEVNKYFKNEPETYFGITNLNDKKYYFLKKRKAIKKQEYIPNMGRKLLEREGLVIYEPLQNGSDKFTKKALPILRSSYKPFEAIFTGKLLVKSSITEQQKEDLLSKNFVLAQELDRLNLIVFQAPENTQFDELLASLPASLKSSSYEWELITSAQHVK